MARAPLPRRSRSHEDRYHPDRDGRSYARNPRKNEAAVAKVAASIREFGFRQPIVVDKEMVVVAGHTRLLAARQLGLKRVPVHVARELTPAQIKAYRLADNRTAEEAEWNDELLKLELADLKEGAFDLGLTGFDLEEINELLSRELADGQADPDDVPEPPEKPGEPTSLATRVFFSAEDKLGVVLTDGREVLAPLSWFPRLAKASPQQRGNWRLIGDGVGIHWPELDEGVSVASLLGLPTD